MWTNFDHRPTFHLSIHGDTWQTPLAHSNQLNILPYQWILLHLSITRFIVQVSARRREDVPSSPSSSSTRNLMPPSAKTWLNICLGEKIGLTSWVKKNLLVISGGCLAIVASSLVASLKIDNYWEIQCQYHANCNNSNSDLSLLAFLPNM